MECWRHYKHLQYLYVVKTAKLEHTHPVGAVEYSLYASERRPGGDLRHNAEALLQNGANPTLVQYYTNFDAHRFSGFSDVVRVTKLS